MRRWFSESVPMGLGDVLRGVTWQLDTLLLGWLQLPEVVGIYSVAYRPLGPLNLVPQAILTAVFPAFVQMAERDRDALDQAFTTSIRFAWLISLPIAVTICIGAKPIILLVASPEYLEATVPLRILIWVTCLSFLSFHFRFLFVALNLQQAYSRLVGLILVLKALVELALIPRCGYCGACAGSVLGELVFTTVGLAICRRWGVGRIEWGALVLAALAGAAMGAVLWAARRFRFPILVPTVAMASRLYFLLCILLGALRRDEVQRLYEALTGSLGQAADCVQVEEHIHRNLFACLPLRGVRSDGQQR
jgi:stage V sporulation protein B